VDAEKDSKVQVSLHWYGFKRARDIGLGILPVAYVLGFLSWSNHNLRLKLGWVPASLERYLALGFMAVLVAVLLAASLLALQWLYRALRIKGRKWAWVVWILVPLAGSLSFIAYGLVLSAVDILLPERSYIWILLSFLGALSGILVQAASSGAEWALARGPGPRIKLRESNGEVVATLPVLFSLLIGTLASSDLSSHINSEFGGTAPAIAKFEVQGEGIVRLQWLGMVESWNATSGLAVTTPLYVFSSDNGYLVRNGTSEPENGPLYEIDKASVLTIHWIRH
jgi:hypothetical protein